MISGEESPHSKEIRYVETDIEIQYPLDIGDMFNRIVTEGTLETELKKSIPLFDMLSRRVDVFAKVHKRYLSNDIPDMESDTIEGDTEILLSTVILYLSEMMDDVKFLNTALKMIDGILGNDTVYPERVVEYADELVERSCGR